MAVRLVLSDDHPFILDALVNLFRAEPDFEVLTCCRNGEEALRAVREHCPDILVLDIRMPRKDGLTVIREMKKEKIFTRVVILTAAVDEEEVVDAIRLGVSGVVLKEMAPRMLVQCIRKVYSGGRWIEPGPFQAAMDKMIRREAGMDEIGRALTQREIELVRMVAKGLRNKEIAQKLSISEGTVKIHLHNVYRKLHVEGRMELILHCQSKGWL